MLEKYMQNALAPLGMLFPFPIHFPKLDSCMLTSAQLWDKCRCDGSSKGGIPSNDQFWQEEVICTNYFVCVHATSGNYENFIFDLTYIR